MNRFTASVIFAFFFSVFSASAFAAVYNVSTSSELVSAMNASGDNTVNVTVPSITMTSYANDITAGKTLTVNGLNSVSAINLGTAGSLRYFAAVNSSYLNLSNLTIMNGYLATSGYGAAVYMTGSDGTFNNVSFINNRTGDTNQLFGGAIFANNSSAVFGGNTNFTSNYCTLYGGGFMVERNTDFTFNGPADFSSNAAYAGGGFYADGSIIEFYGPANFTSNVNTSGYTQPFNTGGAGFYAVFSNITFFNTANFTGNRATRGAGGGFAAYSTDMSFDSVSINSNYALTHGGGFYLNNSRAIFDGTSYIRLNVSSNSGGGFYAGPTSNVIFNGTADILNNTAIAGGGFYTVFSTVSFSGAVAVSSNSASDGGGFYATGTSVYFDSYGEIRGNNATATGGGFYNSGGNIDFSANTDIYGNKAALNGGGFFAYGFASRTNFNGNTSISNNTGGNGGGFYVILGGKVIFNGNSFINGNKAVLTTSGFGGGFYGASDAAVTFNSSVTISSNSAKRGGGFYADNGFQITFSAAASNITGNYADSFGGGFYSSVANIVFNGNTVISGNRTAGAGGGFIATGNSGIYFNSSAAISNNTAVSGGGFNSSGGNIVFYGSATFSNNAATSGSGGAVYLWSNASMTTRDAIFTGNTATENGGAVYLQGASSANTAKLTINTSDLTVFSNNIAGGISNALYIGDYSQVLFNTANGAVVNMYDGIASGSVSAVMISSGPGTFNMYAGAELFDFTNYGQFNFKTAAVPIKVKNDFINKAGAVLDMSGSGTGVIEAASMVNDGKIIMNANSNDTNNQIKVSGGASLGGASSLDIKTSGISTSNFRKKIYYLIGYGSLSGGFSTYTVTGIESLNITQTFSYGSGTNDWITLILEGTGAASTEFGRIEGLTFNQKETARVYDKMSENASGDLDIIITAIDSMGTDEEKRKALGNASGYFLANVIAAGAGETGRADVYDKIKWDGADKKGNGLWAQYGMGQVSVKGDDNSIGEYKDKRNAVMAGYDAGITEKIMLGAYIGSKSHDIDQGSNSGSISNIEAGLYGGVKIEKWDIKALLNVSSGKYETKRSISIGALERKADGDFDGTAIGVDGEIGFDAGEWKKIKMRPYAAIGIKNISYGSMKESGAGSLDIDMESGGYMRADGRAGFEIGQQKERFSWYGGFEGRYLFAGKVPEINGKFSGTEESFASRGAELGSFEAGITGGGSYDIYKGFGAYCNVNVFTGAGINSYYGNAGLRYNFGFSAAAGNAKADKDISKEEQKKAEQKKAEQTKFEQTKFEQAKLEQAKIEQSRIDAEKQKKEEKNIAKAQKKAQIEQSKPEKTKAEEEKKAAAAKKKAESEELKRIEAEKKAKETEIKKAEENKKTALEAEIAEFEANLAKEKKEKEQAKIEQEKLERARAEAEKKAQEEEKKKAEKERIAEEKRLKEEAKNKAKEEARAAAEANKKAEQAKLEEEKARAAKEKQEAKALKEKSKQEEVKAAANKTEALPEDKQGAALTAAAQSVKKDKPETENKVKLKFVFGQDQIFVGNFELSADGVREIRKAAYEISDYIINNPGKVKVVVEGYANATGNASVSQQYSLRRAAEVANELADSDIDYSIIEPKGYGADKFINTKNPAAAENKRVEVKVIAEN